ncbi:snake venom vascular endothelial growth factor toxin [Hoplias malabaricus]|uniref:snake venom vascular endothelial growth factor toxin n=1 Tax=Hoplias malabaricus TaxID=27720 RepID=UPI00346186F9
MLVVCVAFFWVFIVSSSPQETPGVAPQRLHNCDNNVTTTPELSYLHPLLCQTKCQPRETLVKVWHEFPEEIHHTIFPCTVPVQRCAGFCNNEATVCAPEENYTVLMQVLRIDENRTRIELPFVQHSACKCSPRECVNGSFVHC